MEQCLKENLPFPDSIANAPDLLFGLELYYTAFLDLSDSRQIGMGLGPIPWDVVDRYCRSKELTEDQIEEMHYHIKQMDTAYIEHHNRKNKKK